MDQEPSRCLLITIRTLPPSFCLSYEYLYQYFSPYGLLKNILIKQLLDDPVVLVEYDNLNSAVTVMAQLQGAYLTSWGGLYTLTIHYPLQIVHFLPVPEDRSRNLKLIPPKRSK